MVSDCSGRDKQGEQIGWREERRLSIDLCLVLQRWFSVVCLPERDQRDAARMSLNRCEGKLSALNLHVREQKNPVSYKYCASWRSAG